MVRCCCTRRYCAAEHGSRIVTRFSAVGSAGGPFLSRGTAQHGGRIADAGVSRSRPPAGSGCADLPDMQRRVPGASGISDHVADQLYELPATTRPDACGPSRAMEQPRPPGGTPGGGHRRGMAPTSAVTGVTACGASCRHARRLPRRRRSRAPGTASSATPPRHRSAASASRSEGLTSPLKASLAAPSAKLLEDGMPVTQPHPPKAHRCVLLVS